MTPPPDLARKRKLLAFLLLAVDRQPKGRRLVWQRVIRIACQMSRHLEATPGEFNQLLDLRVKELIGGTDEERRPEQADEREGEHEQAG